MSVKLYPENIQIIESEDKTIITVPVQSNVAGSSDITFFPYKPEPFLRGEDYPALVHVWNNDDDDIFD